MMTTAEIETIDEARRSAVVEEYICSLLWHNDTPDERKTLVAGNIRGFAAHLNRRGLFGLPSVAETPVVTYILDDGETCSAIVTKKRDNGTLDLIVVLNDEQVAKYGKDGWWNPEYLKAMRNLPPECACEQGTEPGQWRWPL